jgi:hypothetical protein
LLDAVLPCLPTGWVQEEKARHQHRQAAVQKLRSERQVQLEEQANRRMAAAELRRRGEEELTVRIALDVKHQMEVTRIGPAWQAAGTADGNVGAGTLWQF